MSKRLSDQLPDCKSFLVVTSTAKWFSPADYRSCKMRRVGNSAAAEYSYAENEVLEVEPELATSFHVYCLRYQDGRYQGGR